MERVVSWASSWSSEKYTRSVLDRNIVIVGSRERRASQRSVDLPVGLCTTNRDRSSLLSRQWNRIGRIVARARLLMFLRKAFLFSSCFPLLPDRASFASSNCRVGAWCVCDFYRSGQRATVVKKLWNSESISGPRLQLSTRMPGEDGPWSGASVFIGKFVILSISFYRAHSEYPLNSIQWQIYDIKMVSSFSFLIYIYISISGLKVPVYERKFSADYLIYIKNNNYEEHLSIFRIDSGHDLFFF